MTPVPIAAANDVELCYDTLGDPDGVPVLLIAGLGVQLIDWADHLLAPLVDAGLHLILFDNRDAGLSSRFHGAPDDPAALIESMMAGNDPDIAYTLTDMAGDAVALLDALELESAHLLGMSMGGMIAQTAAIMYPERLRSLVSIMSTTGAPDVGQPTPAALDALLSAPPDDDPETVLRHAIASARIWASPDHFDEPMMRSSFLAAWERTGGPEPSATARQLCAVLASPPRDDLLALVDAPSLVIHGSADTLIAPSGGERTAASIAGAELLLIDGMGHDMPTAFATRIAEAITRHVTGAEAGD